MSRKYGLKFKFAAVLFALLLAMPLYSQGLFDVDVSADSQDAKVYDVQGIDGIDSIEPSNDTDKPGVAQDAGAAAAPEQGEQAKPKKKKGFKAKIEKLKKKGEKIADYIKDVTKDESAYEDTTRRGADSGAKSPQVARDKDFETKKALNKVYHSVKDAIENNGQEQRAEAPEVKGSPSGIVNKLKSIFGFKTRKKIKGFDKQNIEINGKNYCGQFAMTAILNQRGIPADAQKVYKDTNPAGIFTAPPTIVSYLRQMGVKASQKNKASLEDIVRKIDEGKPVMALVNSDGSTPHWVAIYGYQCDSDGNVVAFTMRDSYWGVEKGFDMPIDDFAEAWQNPLGKGFASKLVGYSNLMIDIDGQNASTLDTAAEDNIALGINNAVTGFKNKDFGQALGGAAQLLAGIPGAVVSVASRLPTALGDTVKSWGNEKIAKGGVGNKILGGLAVGLGTACKAVGKVADFIGDVASKAANAIGNFFSKLF